MTLNFGSVCSGIEAASVAWEPLGFRPAFFSEVDPFACALLRDKWPEVPNLGDLTKFETWGLQNGAVDLLVGGTPCQSFSIAGSRKGMDDPRGDLARVFVRLCEQVRPRWIVWENVPGVLSSGGGRDFSAFTGALAQLGYGFAYRILDAQFFGVPQRRRRVFLVGHFGDWRRAAAVLFEQESVRRDSKARRKAGKETSRSLEDGARKSCERLGIEKAGGGVWDCEHAQHEEPVRRIDRNNIVVFDQTQITSKANRSKCEPGSPCHTLSAQGAPPTITGRHVRRLTPTECERLQGFPDGHTAIQFKGRPAKDSPRYRAIGNSMAVPVMRWIGTRILEVEGLPKPL